MQVFYFNSTIPLSLIVTSNNLARTETGPYRVDTKRNQAHRVLADELQPWNRDGSF